MKKIEAYINPYSLTAQITKQTHIYKDFGENGSSFFNCSNGYTLSSQYKPEVILATFFVRGLLRYCNDNILHFSDREHLQYFIDAIKEYNKHFKGYEKPSFAKDLKKILDF